MVVTSAKKVMFSSAFVCFLEGLCKNYSSDFHKIRWKSRTWPRKKRLDFGDNPDCVRVRVRVGARLRLGGARPYSGWAYASLGVGVPPYSAQKQGRGSWG